MIRALATALACASLCASLCAPAHAHPPQRSAAELMDVLMWGREPIGGPFALTGHDGQRRTDKDFRGRFLLVYFGFTHCSDVCPTDLQQIALALEQLGAAGAAVQPLFITLDPARDTPARLASYVRAFHPRLLGLTGSEAQVRQLADTFRLYWRKVPTSRGEYVIDHAAFTFLMDRGGRYVGFFPPGTRAERMLEVMRPVLQGR
jgi:cytochrome oxidase Cu insertion factor (SCO1/SenC/PrrC family)